MASTMIDAVPMPPRSHEATDAWKMLKYAQQSARNLLGLFDDLSDLNITPSDEKQDLLRAMVVAAGIGIESATRDLARNALPGMLNRGDQAASDAAHAYMKGRLREQSADLKELAGVLSSPPPRVGVADIIVADMSSRDLTTGRLGSLTELFAGAGSPRAPEAALREAIACRSEIVDEMDRDPAGRGERFMRTRDGMVGHANTLLACGFEFVRHADERL